jgi:hypothetical protein
MSLITTREDYSKPPSQQPRRISIHRVALLLALAGASAVGGYALGKSAGSDATTPYPAGARAAAAQEAALAQRLRPVPELGALRIPPPPPTAQTTPTTAPTTGTPGFSSPSAAPQASPAPQSAPAPSGGGGGGGGSFDDSG